MIFERLKYVPSVEPLDKCMPHEQPRRRCLRTRYPVCGARSLALIGWLALRIKEHLQALSLLLQSHPPAPVEPAERSMMEGFDENEEMAAMMGFSSFGGTKKRKFDQTNSPKAKEEYSASGANSTELGVRTKALNNEKKGGEGRIDTTSIPQQKASLPPPASGLASFLARGQELPEKPLKVAQSHQKTAPQVDFPVSEIVSFGGPSIPRAELSTLRFGVKNENGDTAYFLPSFVEDPWERLLPSRT